MSDGFSKEMLVPTTRCYPCLPEDTVATKTKRPSRPRPAALTVRRTRC